MNSNSTANTSRAQDSVYEFVKSRIISLEYRPGEWLKAQEIAKQLSLSRTPVREALGRLEQEGLVKRNGKWGYLVGAISFKEVSDLFKIRESLESLAALECMASADEATLADLSQTLEAASGHLAKGDEIRTRMLNREFQAKLARATGNKLLQQLLHTLNDRIWWVGSLHHKTRPARVAESLSENHDILTAIKSGDADAVRDAVLAHIRSSRESFYTYATAVLDADFRM